MLYTIIAKRLDADRTEYEVKISIRASSEQSAMEKAKKEKPGMDTYQLKSITQEPSIPDLL